MVKGHTVGDPNQSGEFLNLVCVSVFVCQTLSSRAEVLAQLGKMGELGYNSLSYNYRCSYALSLYNSWTLY